MQLEARMPEVKLPSRGSSCIGVENLPGMLKALPSSNPVENFWVLSILLVCVIPPVSSEKDTPCLCMCVFDQFFQSTIFFSLPTRTQCHVHVCLFFFTVYFYCRNSAGKITKSAVFQNRLPSGTQARVAPNRKWFGKSFVCTSLWTSCVWSFILVYLTS